MKVSRIFFSMKILRIVEFCFVIMLLLWISTRLPFVVKISGEYFRQLVGVFLHPFFVFAMCNFIVFILFFKSSGHFSGNVTCETELYDSFLDNAAGNCSPIPEIVFEDKQIIVETEKETVTESKVLRRTESEKVKSENVEEISVKLRRSETEKCCRKVECSSEVSPETVEELSNEEFQKTIEEFIAKQIKFHRQEKLAIVLRSLA